MENLLGVKTVEYHINYRTGIDVIKESIKLPTDLRLIQSDFGGLVHRNHSNYMGVMKMPPNVTDQDLRQLNMKSKIRLIKFGDLLIVVILDVQFITPVKVCTYETLVKEFNLDRYCILFKGYGELYKIKRLKNVCGPFEFCTVEVQLKDIMTGKDDFKTNIIVNESVFNLTYNNRGYDEIIVINDGKEIFNKALRKFTDQIKIK